MLSFDDWLNELVACIKALPSPTDEQVFFVLLAEKPHRTKEDNLKLIELAQAQRDTLSRTNDDLDRTVLAAAERGHIMYIQR
jgi:hypothetical protein